MELKEFPVSLIGVEEERGRRRLCPAAVSVPHHSLQTTNIPVRILSRDRP